MRMILDCRRSNLWFKLPSHVQLVTGEGLANLEVETENDASHWLPGCTAEEMKMVGETVNRVKLRAGDVMYPLARSLPMDWSLWICQQIG